MQLTINHIFPDNRSICRLSISLICWRSSVLLSSSVQCSCFIITLHVHRIIAGSLVLKRAKSLTNKGYVSLPQVHYHVSQLLLTPTFKLLINNQTQTTIKTKVKLVHFKSQQQQLLNLKSTLLIIFQTMKQMQSMKHHIP